MQAGLGAALQPLLDGIRNYTGFSVFLMAGEAVDAKGNFNTLT